MQFLRSGACTIHYRTIGLEPGRPVIAFVNSLGTDFRIWEPLIEALGDGFAYILYDKRGHGLSDVGATPYTIADHANDLAALLDHLGVRQAIIWGLSVGGLIAQHLSHARPDLVSALVLSNTAHKIGTASMWDDRIGHVERQGLAPLVDPVMERWFTPAYRTQDNLVYAGARTMLARQDPQGYAATCAAIRDADLTAQASSIKVPTLCVAGSADGSTPPALVETLCSLIPGAKLTVIEDCGHIPCLERPVAYAAAVAPFLTTLQKG